MARLYDTFPEGPQRHPRLFLHLNYGNKDHKKYRELTEGISQLEGYGWNGSQNHLLSPFLNKEVTY